MPVSHAFAKLNLSLEILGKRTDGFHDLVSVMQTVSLADSIAITPGTELQLECSDPELATDTNLVRRAALLLQRIGGTDRGCTIELRKEIPVAGGLGGGSSDAATTLVALSRLWNLPTTCEALHEPAADLGSDVPFFLTGGTALVEGRGERVTPLPAVPTTWYLLVNPALPVSTATIFAALGTSSFTGGHYTRDLAARIRAGQHPGIGVNALQETVFALRPEARACFETVNTLAPGRTMLSGSGPTVFAVCSSRAEAQDLEGRLKNRFWTAVCHSIQPPLTSTPCRTDSFGEILS